MDKITQTTIEKPETSLGEIGSAFFACGWIDQGAGQGVEGRLEVLGENLERYQVGERGTFFYSCPFYTERAESERWLLIKLGHVHDEERMLTAEELLERDLVGPGGFEPERVSGSASLVLFDKQQAQLYIYRNLLSTFEIKYWYFPGNLLVSDNLRLMSLLIPHPALNESVVPQHFIYRAVYGRQTYLQDVERLLAGEQLSWENGEPHVDLVHDLRGFSNSGKRKPVNPETVEWFTEQMHAVVNLYLKGYEGSSATMLSGGVDSSLIQALISRNPRIRRPFSTFSFTLDNPFFAYEVEYARSAATDLATDHQFVRVSEEDYLENLLRGIQILGQPLPDDVRPCFLALTAEIAREHPDLHMLFHGQIADGLHGVGASIEAVQGDKYHRWPPALLAMLGRVLGPISQSKSFGATVAAQILRGRKEINSPRHPLNAVGLYTNWDIVLANFSPTEISQAMTMKRVLGYHYLDSALLVEQLNVLDLVTDGVDPACVVNQFGLFHGKQIVFPYGDEALLKATFAFEPVARYTHGYRVKPLLKGALEAVLPEAPTSLPKGWSGMGEETLFAWMQEGALAELVRDIERPGFMNKTDFQYCLEQPNWFTWNLLTLDVFQKEVLGSG